MRSGLPRRSVPVSSGSSAVSHRVGGPRRAIGLRDEPRDDVRCDLEDDLVLSILDEGADESRAGQHRARRDQAGRDCCLAACARARGRGRTRSTKAPPRPRARRGCPPHRRSWSPPRARAARRAGRRGRRTSRFASAGRRGARTARSVVDVAAGSPARRAGSASNRVRGPRRAARPEVRPGRAAVATRPRGVRASRPARTRNGSATSSTVSGSSATATASVDEPDRSAAEPPDQRVEHGPVEPVQPELVDVVDGERGCAAIAGRRRRRPRTSAKSRTRRSSRLAIRGVPRDRPAISAAPSGSQLDAEQVGGAVQDRASSSGA